MSTQCSLHRKVPHIACVEGMSHIVLGWPVSATKVVGILRTDVKMTTARDFIEGVTVRVAGLKQSLTLATKAMTERNYHSVVVRYRIFLGLGNVTEAWVGTGRNRRARAQSGRERAETIGIFIRILHKFVNAMMSEVTDAHCGVSAKSLLQFQAPSLILSL